MQQFFETRSNGLVMLEDDVHLTYSLEDALKSELICISIRSQNLPDLMQKIVSAGVQDKTRSEERRVGKECSFFV